MTNGKTSGESVVFAVASDLHAHDQPGENSPSSLRVGDDESNPMRHPIAALLNLIDRENLKADALLCPGDLGDKASTVGIQYAWSKLCDVRRSLGARELFATVGNHDVDSRGKENDFDPRGFLQTLQPMFPHKTRTVSDQFWSRHFTIVKRKNYRILLLNSSAFHGYKEEHEHGRVSKHTLAAIRESLLNSDAKPVNLLLCHHHPLSHADRDLGEADAMKQGQELLDLIGNFGEWIVVHGHKHDPKLTYAAGSSTVTPIVFAAGSLSANLFHRIQGTARNQFYILKFPLDEIATHGLLGTFRAWDWIFEKGWLDATARSGLPHTGGFGHLERPISAAARISGLLTEPTLAWSKLLDRAPLLRYLTPRDLSSVISVLEEKHGIAVLDSQGIPSRLERN